MPIISCPACRGRTMDADGRTCWGCDGNGFVELTSDGKADVVRRGGVLVDKRTHWVLPPYGECIIAGLFFTGIPGLLISTGFLILGRLSLNAFPISVANCMLLGFIWGNILGIINVAIRVLRPNDFFGFVRQLVIVGILIWGAYNVVAQTAGQGGAWFWSFASPG